MAISDAITDALKNAGKGALKGAGDYLQGKKSSSASEGPGIDKELGEKARSMKQAGKALGSDSSDDSSDAPVSKLAAKPVKGKTTQPYGSKPGEKSPADLNKAYPDLPKMHKGGMVKKTGPHLLLKGEAVLSKKDTKKVSALGGQENPGPSDAPDGMSIDKVDDGSFHIQHRHNPPADGGPTPKSGKYTARNVKHLIRHVKQHFGGGRDDGMAEPSSFADGGVVQKGGMAQVHAGEKVIPAPKTPDFNPKAGPRSGPKAGDFDTKSRPDPRGGKPMKSPDVYIGGAPKAKPITRAPDRSLDPSVRDREQSLI